MKKRSLLDALTVTYILLSSITFLLLEEKSCAYSDFLLFDIHDSKAESISLSKHQQVEGKTYTEQNARVFSLSGNPEIEVLWYIPIKREIFSPSCTIQLNVQSINLQAPKNKAIVSLGIKKNYHLQDRKTILSPTAQQITSKKNRHQDKLKQIPLFIPAGITDNLITELSWELPGKIFLEGIFINLALISKGDGVLTITSLRIVLEDNILAAEEIENILREAPPIHAYTQNDSGLGVTLCVLKNNGKERKSLITFQGGVAPIDRVTVNFGGSTTFFPNNKPLWVHPHYIDFPEIDHALAKKQRFIIVDVLLGSAPLWWQQMQKKDQGGKTSVAILSDYYPPWMNYCQVALKQLLAYLRKSPYADRVIGCNVILGLGMNHFPYPFRDQSHEYTKSFRQWLRQRYQNVNQLKKAWGNEQINFHNAIPVDQALWAKGDLFSIIHPSMHHQASDSYRFYSYSWAKTCVNFSRLIKKYTCNRYLSYIIGGHGFFLNNLWNNTYPLDASEALDLILQSPFVDGIDIPLNLTNIDSISTLKFILNDELKKHKKVLFLGNKLPFSLIKKAEEHTFKDAKELLETHRRIFAASLVHRAFLYYPDMNLMSEKIINQFEEISRKSIPQNMPKKAEVLFLIDFDLFLSLAPDKKRTIITAETIGNSSLSELPFLSSEPSSYFSLLTLPRLSWERIGVPYDILPISADIDIDEYKTIVLFHILQHNEHKDRIIEDAKKSGITIISMWANGLLTKQQILPLGMEKITGMTTKIIPYLSPHDLYYTKLFREFLGFSPSWSEKKYVTGKDRHFSEPSFHPMFVVNDPKTISFMERSASSSVLALKHFPSWKSLYSASPIITPEVLRKAAEKSGVHIYFDNNDITFIAEPFIAIISDSNGVRKLSLPIKSPLYEIFRDQEIPEKKEHFFQMKAKRTYLFFRGTRVAWDRD